VINPHPHPNPADFAHEIRIRHMRIPTDADIGWLRHIPRSTQTFTFTLPEDIKQNHPDDIPTPLTSTAI